MTRKVAAITLLTLGLQTSVAHADEVFNYKQKNLRNGDVVTLYQTADGSQVTSTQHKDGTVESTRTDQDGSKAISFQNKDGSGHISFVLAEETSGHK